MSLLSSGIYKLLKKRSLLVSASIVAFALTVIFKFVILPFSVSTTIESISESYGLDISTGDLTTEITDLKVSLKDVEWSVSGKYSSNEIFSADAISLDLNFINFLKSGFKITPAIHEILVSDATLHIENKNSKRWNWQDSFNQKKALRYVTKEYKKGTKNKPITQKTNLKQSANLEKNSQFTIPAVNFEGLDIVWVEEMPANSGNGRIVRSRSEFRIEDVTLVVKNIIGLFQDEDDPMEIDFDGRTSDGIIQASGEVNLFSWGSSQPNSAVFKKTISNIKRKERLTWKPTADLNIYLENIDAASLSQMIPDSSINATTGTMSGNIKVNLNYDQVVDFSSQMMLTNMSWGINNAVYIDKDDEIKEQLNKYKNQNMLVTVGSKGSLSDSNFRLIPSFQTSLTREAVKKAPKSIQYVATKNQLQYEDQNLSPLASELKRVKLELEALRKTQEDAERKAQQEKELEQKVKLAKKKPKKQTSSAQNNKQISQINNALKEVKKVTKDLKGIQGIGKDLRKFNPFKGF